MSLVTFSEAYSLSTGIEVEGFVKSMEKGQEIWIDYLQDYRRVCNAKLTDGKGNIINIAFWGDDISKVRNNLKIHITDAKWDDLKKVLYKTKFGKIIVCGFNPNNIYDDILNLKNRNKIKSFNDYFKHIETIPGSIYLSKDKKEYLVICKALAQIEKFASKFRNSTVSSAIKYLYNKITLSAEQIHSILKIFDICIPCERILRNTIPSKLTESKAYITRNPFKITTKNTIPETIHLQTIIDLYDAPTSSKLPSEISIVDSSEDEDFTPVMIENIKHCRNYDVSGDSKC